MKRILVVEDEPLIAMEVESILEDGGHVVVGVARDADAAFAMAEREKPDAATMDIDLARKTSGLDAAERLYRRLGVRSVFVSSRIDARVIAAAADFEPLGFVSKPPWKTELLAALRKLE
ncbi:response regulator [Chenggangzhangella methanolivorans]|uniref:Response regulator n=1 Tax=Chenggangzhangella methanolivorans TaxID=1437009 RepID=A0A9E6R9W3_9HYPH|nr:response regulator [Chenggangzhangella methanolivorans]QZN99322.1 response regulator [Chenggangzhangella methanolivorans]